MLKSKALEFIKDSIKTDIKLGWSGFLAFAPIPSICKISQLEDLYQCWGADNLQQLLNNMVNN